MSGSAGAGIGDIHGEFFVFAFLLAISILLVWSCGCLESI